MSSTVASPSYFCMMAMCMNDLKEREETCEINYSPLITLIASANLLFPNAFGIKYGSCVDYFPAIACIS